ncbi:hypothetical protein F0562_020669 [Nyssa sinensis]|uniref:EF-hand domain-containing protein n=1 Tax=Nyssa sinensis TaxID=561372 RepID=A0A5J5BUX4_9ASTE|nr:hypothetical protein F0562_020669 [Nyssa sinensis]
MSNLSFLEFQYNFSKIKFLRKPTLMLSSGDRQDSGVPVYQVDQNEIKQYTRTVGLKTMDIQSAFQTFDLDGDGKISAEEVFDLLRRLGEKCSLPDCRRMVKGVDTNEDGVIDMDEFMTMMTRTMRLC